MHTTIKFAKVKPEAIIPSKKIEDAGYDVYACFGEDYIMINSFETKMIPTGIASACDTDYCIVLKERGSSGTKGIAQRCGIIDSGFRNEWFVPITNTTNKTLIIIKKEALKYSDLDDGFIIYPYEKAICQALVIPVPTTDVEEYTYEELLKIPSKRGIGMLGSSNK